MLSPDGGRGRGAHVGGGGTLEGEGGTPAGGGGIIWQCFAQRADSALRELKYHKFIKRKEFEKKNNWNFHNIKKSI